MIAKKPKEPKRARFVRLAEKRMKVMIKGLRLLGNLSNRSVYEYTESDVERMTEVLLKEVADFTQRMKHPNKQIAFSFDREAAE